MKALANILSQQIIQKLGWTLLHFIWQAAAVALLLAILLRVLRKSTANVRYVIACLALGLIVLLPVVTLHLVPISASYPTAPVEPAPVPSVLPMEEAKQVPVAEMPVLEGPVQLESVAITPKVSWRQRAVDVLEPALPYIVSAWLVGVFGLSLWHLGGWTQMQRLRRRMVKQIGPPWQSKLKELARLLGIRRAVQLMESALVRVPTVVGWLRPVILLPASALTGLSTEQLEAVLAHELAHIKRFDYLVNILQTVVEILGYYHPAVWWVSHKIRAERENCCDDLAVSISGDRVHYAKALTSMEEIRNARPNLAVAATGGSLFKRISRLLGKDSQPNSRSSWAPAVIAIMLIAALAIPTTLALTASKSQKTDVQGEEKDRPAESVQRGDMAFHEALSEMDRLRKGKNTPWDKVDQMVMELTAKYRDPADQGLIYYFAVRVHGQSGLYRPETCIKYAEKAEPLLTDPLRQIQLYVDWGNAIQRKHWGASGQKLAVGRRELAPIYLRGVKVALDHNLPDKLSPRPTGPDLRKTFGPIVPPSENSIKDLPPHIRKGWEEYRKNYPNLKRDFDNREAIYRAQVKAYKWARSLWEFQEEMMYFRELVRDKSIQYYAKMPFDTAEFKEMAAKILQDEKELNLLMGRLQELIRKRTGQPKTKEPDVQVEAEEVEPNNSEVTGAKERVPIHPWHRRRVENIRAETIEQTIENVANFDDAHFAMTAVSRGFTNPCGDMFSAASYVFHLFRVRRLLAEGRANPGTVVPLLKAAYKEALDAWPRVYAEKLKRGFHAKSEADLFDKVYTKALAATYLLAELQDHESLPLLVAGYKRQYQWMEEIKPTSFGRVPVPIPFTLYAIHRLASTLKPEQMGHEALAARQVYMEWAEKNLLPPKEMVGTAWHADYDESDPYRRIVDPQGRVLVGQSKISLVKCPYTFKDGTLLQEGGWGRESYITAREKEWAKLLLEFVEVACKDKPDVQVDTKTAESAEKLRKLNTALLMYANDYDDKYPYKIPQIELVTTKVRCPLPNGQSLLIAGQNITVEENDRKVNKTLIILLKAQKPPPENPQHTIQNLKSSSNPQLSRTKLHHCCQTKAFWRAT